MAKDDYNLPVGEVGSIYLEFCNKIQGFLLLPCYDLGSDEVTRPSDEDVFVVLLAKCATLRFLF